MWKKFKRLMEIKEKQLIIEDNKINTLYSIEDFLSDISDKLTGLNNRIAGIESRLIIQHEENKRK